MSRLSRRWLDHFFVIDILDGCAYINAMGKRTQINIRVDEKDLERIENLRRRLHPIPTVTGVIKVALKVLEDQTNEHARRKKQYPVDATRKSE